MTEYQPKTGARCACKRGIQRDNCPVCEGTGWQIDFRAIRIKPSCIAVHDSPLTRALRAAAGASANQSAEE